METKELSRPAGPGHRPPDDFIAKLRGPILSDRTIDYRGHTIAYHRTLAGWIARFRKSGSYTFVSSAIATATLDDGETVLLTRARTRIDALCADGGESH